MIPGLFGLQKVYDIQNISQEDTTGPYSGKNHSNPPEVEMRIQREQKMKSSLEGKSLRKKAEKILPKKRMAPQKISPGDTGKLIHELEVHQIELEMQNQELRKAQEELETSRKKYVDLYDFAPVGYFTLDKDGIIMEANLMGASLLGIDRKRLLKSFFLVL